MSKKGFFVAIIGIDGSGKTTLCKNLLSDYEFQEKFNFRYRYVRYIPLILKPALRIIQFYIESLSTNSHYGGVQKEKKRKMIIDHPFLLYIYYNLMLVDYYFQILVKVSIPLFLGKNIICDRYVYDTIITDIAAERETTLDEILMNYSWLIKKSPKPDIVFMIDIKEDIAYKRKDDIESIRYLVERRDLYLQLAKRKRFNILEGKIDKESILFKVKKEIEGCLL